MLQTGGTWCYVVLKPLKNSRLSNITDTCFEARQVQSSKVSANCCLGDASVCLLTVPDEMQRYDRVAGSVSSSGIGQEAHKKPPCRQRVADARYAWDECPLASNTSAQNQWRGPDLPIWLLESPEMNPHILSVHEEAQGGGRTWFGGGRVGACWGALRGIWAAQRCDGGPGDGLTLRAVQGTPQRGQLQRVPHMFLRQLHHVMSDKKSWCIRSCLCTMHHVACATNMLGGSTAGVNILAPAAVDDDCICRIESQSRSVRHIRREQTRAMFGKVGAWEHTANGRPPL